MLSLTASADAPQVLGSSDSLPENNNIFTDKLGTLGSLLNSVNGTEQKQGLEIVEQEIEEHLRAMQFPKRELAQHLATVNRNLTNGWFGNKMILEDAEDRAVREMVEGYRNIFTGFEGLLAEFSQVYSQQLTQEQFSKRWNPISESINHCNQWAAEAMRAHNGQIRMPNILLDAFGLSIGLLAIGIALPAIVIMANSDLMLQPSMSEGRFDLKQAAFILIFGALLTGMVTPPLVNNLDCRFAFPENITHFRAKLEDVKRKLSLTENSMSEFFTLEQKLLGADQSEQARQLEQISARVIQLRNNIQQLLSEAPEPADNMPEIAGEVRNYA